MKKKILSIILAGTMVSSVVAAGSIAVHAEDGELAPGGYGTLGEYTPNAGVKTNHLMFAMPRAWQNDTTKNEKCGGAAGIYWWSGYQTPDDVAGGHGWPGYKAVQVKEEGVDNLWAIDVPTYYNGDNGNATAIIWNNYLDGGMETDPVKNPFYDAAVQTRDFPGQYYSRIEENETYELLFRYAYKKAMKQANVEGADALDIQSETFWEDINKLAAASLKAKDQDYADWDSLSAEEKGYQIDLVLDTIDLDLSEFGDYASNFFNEDLVESPEKPQYYGISFVFDNMVFVVNFDPAKMQESPVSHKIGFDGEFYFYYGNGEYGSWPTKALNEQMKDELGEDKVVSGNFTKGDYVTKTMDDVKKDMEKYYEENPDAKPKTDDNTAGSVPAPATDASSGTSNPANGSNSANNANGAIATGQISFAVIAFVVLIAGVGAVYFSRKKREE